MRPFALLPRLAAFLAFPCALTLLAFAPPAFAQTPVTGSSASRWVPMTTWVTAGRSKTYSVHEAAGALVFTAAPAGTQIPFRLSLKDDEMSGDDRYLVVHYKASGLNTAPGNYFLHGVEGTYGGRTYALSQDCIADGQWHYLAVDLITIEPVDPTYALAFKLVVADAGVATLTVDRIFFTDTLPPGAKLSSVTPPTTASTSLDWRQLKLIPRPSWTHSPATDFSATVEGAAPDSAATFVVRGQGKQMRWPLALPRPVDLAAMPYFSVRYKASGAISPTTYSIWLGDDPTGAGGHQVVPLNAADLRADGQWHNFTVKLTARFKAVELAVGLDSAGPEATLTLGPIRFSSQQPLWHLADVLKYRTRASAWPAGRDGLTVLKPAVVTGGHPSAWLQRRLDLSDWFPASRITVDGLPFDVSTDLLKVQQSGTAALGALTLKLPADAREVLLLTAAAAPSTEPWGIDSKHARPQDYLSEPEKVAFEIRYASGPPDFVLPLDMATSKWGMKRGLGVCVVHPDTKRHPTSLILHDGMETATFAILGATVSTAKPRIPEPTWAGLTYPSPTTNAYEEGYGFTGDVRCHLKLKGSVDVNARTFFEVEIAGKTLATDAWKLVKSEGRQSRRPTYTFHCASPALTATVAFDYDGAHDLLARMSLHNDGPTKVTATVRFPVLHDLKLGTAGQPSGSAAADTWYLSGKRGGIINHVPFSTRDALGEQHPLQMDGFFNPRTDLALACLTYDTAALHHFIDLSKTAAGGSWSPEYVLRDIAPGGTFRPSVAALLIREGDWRAIFDAYRDWLKTWYHAPKSKPWWERTFAFLTISGSPEGTTDPKQRSNIQQGIATARKYLGVCDYIHIFGWATSAKYGIWGDYDHYDETVGGLAYFRDKIARAQKAGIAVGLYQDGYLNSAEGEYSGAHAREWAMKNADQSPEFVTQYKAYNECPFLKPWQNYLTSVYARIHRDFHTKGLYIDEYGATDARWLCRAKDHGHNGYQVPYKGEVEMLRKIRAAVGPDVALYTEYPGAEVERTIVDGSFGYQTLWSVDQEPLAPEFIDLPRFAFPKFKQFQILYYVPTRAGNWWLLKFPFFNGESYDLGEPNLTMADAPSIAFLRRAVQVLCKHREAFSSHNVTPLIKTKQIGVFANRFSGRNETVWTLYNANGRTIRGIVFSGKHLPGATYEDAWNGKPLHPKIVDGRAQIAVELGPKAVGCIVQYHRR